MDKYGNGRAASSAPKPQKSKRRGGARPHRNGRFSVEAWAGLRSKVDNEHRRLHTADPNSPRVKPTLGTIGQVLVW